MMMYDAGKSSRILHLLIVIVVMVFAGACKTPTTTSSSGASGPSTSAGASGSSTSAGASGTAGMPDSSSAGDVSVSVSSPGLPSGTADGLPATVPVGQTQGDTATGASVGVTVKADDEILQQALAELNKRPAVSAGQTEGQTSGAGGVQASGTGARASQAGSPGVQADGRTAAGQPVQASGSAMSSTERKQALNEKLSGELAEFDRIMLSEQQAMTEKANQDGYRGSFPEESGDDSAYDEASDTEPRSLQTAMLGENDSASLAGEGNIATRARSVVPPDLVDASGDDIIARQLREAAMKEQDPELREKLWDEYRKYKRDSR